MIRARSRSIPFHGSLLLAALLTAAPARAGGGPENVLLVVNVNSWSSLTVANHYAQWRQIPASNIVYVNWRFSDNALPVADFRRLLLGPVVQEMHKRRLDEQVDYIVYSSDFPTAIDIEEDLRSANPPKELTPVGSLTGMTFLWNQVLPRDPRYVVPQANAYCRERQATTSLLPTHGFRQWYGWGEGGELREAGGRHYLLSTMLAVTHGRGNSVREALRALNAAARADGTRPAGSIYFLQNSDVRSRSRDGKFTAAVRLLNPMGIKASVLRGALPRGKSDVQGLVIGMRQFDWGGSQSKIQPGAVCENFTSFGGVFHVGAEQTPLTEFIRHGAAGSSGTVFEPYAMPDKFPSPLLHVHYARGCTLAESFYQSIACPYQLLIVGDPLCRPWSRIPEVTVVGVVPGAKVSGALTLVPTATSADARQAPDRFELFLDGNRVGHARAGDSFQLDTAPLADGYHELRVVGVENSAIETQGRAIVPIVLDNHGRSIELTLKPNDRWRWGQPAEISVRSPGAKSIALFRNGATIAQLDGEQGVHTLEPATLGYGPVVITASAMADDPQPAVTSSPQVVQIAPYEPLPPRSPSDTTADGLALSIAGGAPKVITDTTKEDWLTKAGVAAGQDYVLSGVHESARTDVYQFHLRTVGRLTVHVDGRAIAEFASDEPHTRIVPVVLAAGPHAITAQGKAGERVLLDIRFGNQGVAPLSAAQFRH